MPEENLHQATLDSAAIADHEMFMSWVRAGFSKAEAMDLLLAYKCTVWSRLVELAGEEE